MEKLNKAFEEIESNKVIVDLNTVSGFDNFLRAAETLESVNVILSEITDSNNCLVLLKRIVKLSEELFDHRYENRCDVPLALYTWLLSIKNFTLGAIAAKIVEKVPNCWWASKTAKNILLGIKAYNEADEKEIELLADVLTSKIATPVTEETILSPNFIRGDEISGIIFPSETQGINMQVGNSIIVSASLLPVGYSICSCLNQNSS
jgi:hypothetical protein